MLTHGNIESCDRVPLELARSVSFVREGKRVHARAPLWQLWQCHAISPRSAKVRLVRDETRQSGHLRTAPDGVRLFLILSRHSLWILRRTQRESARGGGGLAPNTCARVVNVWR